MLTSETPQRRIQLNGSLISAADWISQAFQRPHELAREVLEQSQLVFLAEDAAGRWRNHLNRWEAEQTYEGKLRLAAEAESMAKVDPIPEVLEGNYKYLTDITKDVASKLQAMEGQLSSIERELERAERAGSMPHSIRFGLQLLTMGDEVSNPAWPPSFEKQCNDLLTIARAQIERGAASWIPSQLCRSVAQLSDFRHQAERQVKGLEKLGFGRASQELSKQVQGSIQRVEQLQKYSLTLGESDDYPRQPLPTDSTTARSIRDSITTGTRLIEAIRNTHPALSPTEIQARVDAIERRQTLLRDALARKRDALGEVYKAATSEQQLRESLIRARQLQEIFSGTPDESEISEVILQMERVLGDIDSWPSERLSVERLENLLDQQITVQAAKILAFIEEREIDPAWPIETLYRAIANERTEKARRSSDEWIQPWLALSTHIDGFDLSQCKELEEELENAPTFLSTQAREQVKTLQEALSMRLAILEEGARLETFTQWMGQLPNEAEIPLLGRHESENAFQWASNCPCNLTAQEAQRVESIVRALTHRIDQLGIEELFNRIRQLSIEHQLTLKQLLTNLISDASAQREEQA
jgi:Mg2+ and Co2+ transporter CorA